MTLLRVDPYGLRRGVQRSIFLRGKKTISWRRRCWEKTRRKFRAPFLNNVSDATRARTRHGLQNVQIFSFRFRCVEMTIFIVGHSRFSRGFDISATRLISTVFSVLDRGESSSTGQYNTLFTHVRAVAVTIKCVCFSYTPAVMAVVCFCLSCQSFTASVRIRNRSRLIDDRGCHSKLYRRAVRHVWTKNRPSTRRCSRRCSRVRTC